VIRVTSAKELVDDQPKGVLQDGVSVTFSTSSAFKRISRCARKSRLQPGILARDRASSHGNGKHVVRLIMASERGSMGKKVSGFISESDQDHSRTGEHFFKTNRACVLTLRNAPEWPLLKERLDLNLQDLVDTTYADIFPRRAFLAQCNAPRLGSILKR
jgi:hypothetical protein